MKKIFTILSMFFAVGAMNAQNATIILEAHDLWGDGTGYQILLDAEAVAVDALQGNFTCGDDAAYAVYEYKIPTNAAPEDLSVVVDGVQTLEIPAGTYDYVVLNPGCNDYDVVYVASDQCDPSVGNDVTFEAGMTYHFTMSIFGSNDCVTITNGGVGITETASNKVSIYPNPVNDVLNVNAAGFDKVEIVNFLGQVVYSNQVTATNFQINTADLTAGVYFVRLSGDNIVTKKFVKE